MKTGFVIVGVLFIGLAVVYVVSQSSGVTTSGSGLRNDNGNFWGFAGHLLTDLEKAVPKWFDKGGSINDDDLNRYPSSSGFADHG